MRAMLGLLWLLHFLPLAWLARIGEALGGFLYLVLGTRRHITLTNLRLCFPEWSVAQREAVARRHFQVYVRSVFERSLLWWASERRLRRLIRVEPGVPHTAYARQPTIFFCPHFVSLDVAGVAVTLEQSLCSIYTTQRNRVFDAALRRGRSRFHPVQLFSRAEGIKPILRAMREGLPYFMLPDMDFGRKDAVFVPFFGVPAATLTALPRLAASTGAQIIPVIATLLPDYQGWRVRFLPPLNLGGGQDLEAGAAAMNRFIEEYVREAPAEYFWSHKRFKTRPEGENSVYGAMQS